MKTQTKQNRVQWNVATIVAALMVLALAVGCGGLPRPSSLDEYAQLTEDERSVREMEFVAEKQYKESQAFYQKAVEACENDQADQCDVYSQIARIKLETSREKVRRARANQQREATEKTYAQLDARHAKDELKRQQRGSDQSEKKYAATKGKLDKLLARDALFAEAVSLFGSENVKQVEDSVVVTMRGLFAIGKTQVSADQQERVRQLATLATTHEQFPIVIEGYTDSTGRKTSNVALSHGRAQQVMDALIAENIPLDRVKAIGQGPAHPISDNSTRTGREINRRVEVRFLFHSGQQTQQTQTTRQ